MNLVRCVGIFAAFLTVAPVFAQPVINAGGVVNGASFASQFFPNGGIAQGSMFSIFGTGLGPADGVSAPAFPLETSLAGVQVSISQGGTVRQAIPWFVRQDQINAIMPSNAPLGEVDVTVTFGQTSAPVKARVVKSNFAAFAVAGGPGRLTNFVSETEQPDNTMSVTAQPGQFVTVWGTGLGPTAKPDTEQPGLPPVDLRGIVNVRVWVGNQEAPNVFYAGRSAQFAGVDQLIFAVPESAPSGCWVPVIVESDGVPGQRFTMAIDADGQPCSDPLNPFSDVIVSGGNLGVMLLIRAGGELAFAANQNPTPFTWDLFAGSFVSQPGGDYAYNFFMSLPPVGACLTAGGNLDVVGFLSSGQLPDINLGEEVDGGENINVRRTADNATVDIPRIVDRGYVKTTGGGIAGGPPPFWNPEAFNVTSSGGAEVGPVNVNVNFPTSVTWTNSNALGLIVRADGATFTWTGGSTEDVVVLAGANVNLDEDNPKASIFYCLSPQPAGSYTVPPSVLNSMIRSTAQPMTLGFAGVGVIPVGSIAEFTATGLAGGAALPAIVDLRVAAYQ